MNNINTGGYSTYEQVSFVRKASDNGIGSSPGELSEELVS